MHPQPIIASILVCGVIAVVAVSGALISAAIDLAIMDDDDVWGDVPLVPMELRLPDRKAGGAAEQGRGAVTDDIARHVGTGK